MDFAQLFDEARKGNGEAAWQLGDLYREASHGVKFSPKQAFRWYAESALGGSPTGQNNVGAGPPTYVDEYGQWDLSASYQFTDNLTTFVDVINLTNETNYVYGRAKDQVLFATQLGTRYNVGVRYRF